jgi:hypothetical protein
MTATGSAVAYKQTGRPVMMLVAWPVRGAVVTALLPRPTASFYPAAVGIAVMPVIHVTIM